MINWKARLKNKAFWIAIIPATILLVQAIAAVFGITIDLSVFSGRLLAVVEAVFVVLAILGIVVDTSTEGFSDKGE